MPRGKKEQIFSREIVKGLRERHRSWAVWNVNDAITPGVPDLIVITPETERTRAATIWLELKIVDNFPSGEFSWRGAGGKGRVSPEQKAWLQRLHAMKQQAALLVLVHRTNWRERFAVLITDLQADSWRIALLPTFPRSTASTSGLYVGLDHWLESLIRKDNEQ